MPQVVTIVAALLVGGVVALLAEQAFRASGRHGLHFRSFMTTAPAADQPSPEEFEAMLHSYNLFQAMERSPLSRVIGVGAVQSSDGITVEFISVELREAGGRGVVRFHSSQGYRPSMGPPGSPREPAPPTIQDGVGTRYSVAWSSRGASGGGDYSEATAEFVFAPAPPPGPHQLEISVPRLDPPGDRRRPASAPWVFELPL